MIRLLLIAIFLMGCATPFEHRTTLPTMDVIISDDCNGHRGLAWADSAEICVEGYLENDGTITVNQEVLGHSAWNWTPDAPIYMASSAGSMTQTRPSAASAIVRVVGYGGRNSNCMWFDPDKTWIEV